MKAIVKEKPEQGLSWAEVPVPEIQPNEVLIKIQKTAICGTDVHIYSWNAWAQKNIPVPLVIGHEFFGTIEKIGASVRGLKKGDRVSGEGHITCGTCRNCRAGRRHLCRNTIGIGVHRTGAFAEYLSLPAENVFPIPDDIPDEIASFFDPLGNAVHTALSFDLIGEDVLITGAGPIGIMATAICRHVGARHIVVVDPNEFRLQLAKTMGATKVLNPLKTSLQATMQELSIVEGFDVGLEMSGNSSAFQSMLDVMNHGGKVAVLGVFPGPIQTNWDQIIFKGLIIKGIYGREMFETWYKMKTLLQSGLNVRPVITHQLPIQDFLDGFQAMKTGNSGKVILHW